MNKLLMNMLQCPKCKGDLIYKFDNDNEIEIYNGRAICTKCKKVYEIKEGIIDFVNNIEVHNIGVKEQLDFFLKENRAIKEDLLNTNIEDMNASDTWALYLLKKAEGKNKEAEMILPYVSKKMYSMQTSCIVEKMMKNIADVIKNENKFVLDVASGYCNLCFNILENTECSIIATDNNIHCLEDSMCQAKKRGYDSSRINFVVCDLAQSPFKNSIFSFAITFVGLQNVCNPQNIVRELRRIVYGKFLSISTFCDLDDKINQFVLRKNKIIDTWIKDRYIELFVQSGWRVECLQSEKAKVKGTRYGEIVKWIKVDRFPIKDTEFEYAVMLSE